MDQIWIRDLEIFARHGVFPEENKLGQKFLVTILMETDTHKAGGKDDLELSIDYGTVSHLVTEHFTAHTWKLIETAAESVARTLLTKSQKIKRVQVEVKKPWAPVGLPLKDVSVKIERSWHRAYLALGSNMGDRKGYLDMAVEDIKKNENCVVRKVSSYINTAPYGGVEQDDFLNACMEVDTLLTPHGLLEFLHKIEKKAGRKRVIHWGPRTLDLDILMYDKEVFEDEDLIIPHVEMHKREFVLTPMAEIAPYLRHPIYQKTMAELERELRGES